MGGGFIGPRIPDLGISYRRVVSFTSRPLSHGEWATGTHSMGDRVGPKIGLDDVDRREILPLLDSNSDPWIVQPVGSRYTGRTIPTP
jgi:hypothetical protein